MPGVLTLKRLVTRYVLDKDFLITVLGNSIHLDTAQNTIQYVLDTTPGNPIYPGHQLTVI